MTVDDLIRKLETGPIADRVKAVEELSRLNDPKVVPTLRHASRNMGIEVRRAAIEALRRLEHDKTVVVSEAEVAYAKTVVVARGDEGKGARQTTAPPAEAVGPSAVPGLIDILGDDRKTMAARKDAAWKLYKIGGGGAHVALVEALRYDELRFVLQNLLIHKIGAPATPALIDTLENAPESVQLSVIQCLGEIGQISAVPALMLELGPSMRMDDKVFDALHNILANCRDIPQIEEFLKQLREGYGELERNDDVDEMRFQVPLSELAEKARSKRDTLGRDVLSKGKPKPPGNAEKGPQRGKPKMLS